MFGTSRQVKLGAFFSYILIIINSLYGVFLTPYIVLQLGDASYGVYKTISSFTSSLMVLDLGLGGTMMRYISKFRADREESRIPNFAGMGFIQAGVLSVVAGMVSIALYFSLDSIYKFGLTASELEKAKQLYIFLAIGIVFHIFENLINGIISGYNRFAFANGAKIVRLVIRVVAVFIFLNLFKDPLTLVVIDLIATFLLLVFELIYLCFVLKFKVSFKTWDKKLFASSFRYTVLLFVSSIVGQVNTNFANIAIGAIVNATAVTIYSMALLISSMFQQLSTAISGVMLPTVTESLSNDSQYKKTSSLVCKVGRVQFVLLGAVFAGFITLGQPFVDIWLGDGYSDVYYLTIILLCPDLLELCINVCLSILRAENKIGFRTLVVSVATVLNAVATFVGLFYFGYYAAAIGTAMSVLTGSVIVMGIYYYKVFKINILKLYRQIFKGTWICVLLSGLAAYSVSLLFSSSLMKFVLGFIAFVVVYLCTLLLFGLNKEEKNIIFSKLRRCKNG